MAMRQVLLEQCVEFDPKDTRKFSVDIPESFLQDEPDRILKLWTKFQISAKELCKTRNSSSLNRRYQKIVFHTCMEKLCHEFSRCSENLKLTYSKYYVHERNGEKKRRRKVYQLRIVKLSEIPDSSRQARFCLAEVPTLQSLALVQEVRAEEVDQYDDNLLNTPQLEILSMSEPSSPSIRQEDEQFSTDYYKMVNPPVATSTVVSVPETERSGQKQADSLEEASVIDLGYNANYPEVTAVPAH